MLVEPGGLLMQPMQMGARTMKGFARVAGSLHDEDVTPEMGFARRRKLPRLGTYQRVTECWRVSLHD